MIEFEWDENKNQKNLKKHDVTFEEDTMREEYDFSGGIRGKHYKAYRQGHTVHIHKMNGTTESHYFTEAEGSIMLHPDVKLHFPC